MNDAVGLEPVLSGLYLDEVRAPPKSLTGWIPKAVPLVRVQGAKLLGGFRAEP